MTDTAKKPDELTGAALADVLERKMAEMPNETGKRALKLYMLAQFAPVIAEDIMQRAVMLRMATASGDGKLMAEASVAFMAAVDAVDYVYAQALIPTLRGAKPGEKLDVTMPPEGTKFH